MVSLLSVSGDLPGSRVARKCEQLENLAQAVVHVARPGQVIVDFCSGGVSKKYQHFVSLSNMFHL